MTPIITKAANTPNHGRYDEVEEEDEDEPTVRGSHELVAGLLFASPLYTACQLQVPGPLNPRESEMGTTPFVTVTVETRDAEPLQEPPP